MWQTETACVEADPLPRGERPFLLCVDIASRGSAQEALLLLPGEAREGDPSGSSQRGDWRCWCGAGACFARPVCLIRSDGVSK